MLLTEYEGKQLLRAAGIAIPNGFLADAKSARRATHSFPVAVKAQVATGSRGLAGGVAKATCEADVEAQVKRILDTEFDGLRPESVLVEEWLPIERELYLSVVVDGRAGGYAVLYAPVGGVHIEEGPAPIRYEVGAPSDFRGHVLRELLTTVEPDSSVRERIIALARRLLKVAALHDCLTVEINPVAKLANGALIAADAKLVLDESARFRQAGTAAAIAKERAREAAPIARALEGKLMLVWLDGEIGLISGGAGMTMAAMDMVEEAGGRPACFLDCSNNPTPDGYKLAFELLDAQPSVKVILVTIFGGLTQMNRVARVMRDLMRVRTSTKPVVFRLNGTNAEQVEGIFNDCGLTNHASLESAVQTAVVMSRNWEEQAA